MQRLPAVVGLVSVFKHEIINKLAPSELIKIAKYWLNPDYATALLEEKIKNNPNIDFWLDHFKKDNINKLLYCGFKH